MAGACPVGPPPGPVAWTAASRPGVSLPWPFWVAVSSGARIRCPGGQANGQKATRPAPVARDCCPAGPGHRAFRPLHPPPPECLLRVCPRVVMQGVYEGGTGSPHAACSSMETCFRHTCSREGVVCGDPSRPVGRLLAGCWLGVGRGRGGPSRRRPGRRRGAGLAWARAAAPNAPVGWLLRLRVGGVTFVPVSGMKLPRLLV